MYFEFLHQTTNKQTPKTTLPYLYHENGLNLSFLAGIVLFIQPFRLFLLFAPTLFSLDVFVCLVMKIASIPASF